jgi:hypothetical protein
MQAWGRVGVVHQGALCFVSPFTNKVAAACRSGGCATVLLYQGRKELAID